MATATTNPSQSIGGTNATANGTAIEIPANLSDALPAEKKYYAAALIDSIETDSRRDAHAVERAHDRINGTLQYYRGPTRVTSSRVFIDDAAGVRALRRVRSDDARADARRASRLVYEADNESARTAVQDARHVLEVYGDEMDNRGRRQAAQAHLDNANRALDRADRAIERGNDRRAMRTRARSLAHLRTAHRHAQIVLRFVDRDVEAQVTVDQTADPIRSGNETVRYPVSGNISTVRPSELGNVTVTVNDDRTVTTQPRITGVGPGENVSYRTTVNLTERVATIEVRVSTSDRGPDEDEPEHGERGEVQQDRTNREHERVDRDTHRDDRRRTNHGRDADRDSRGDDREERQDGRPTTAQGGASATLNLDGDGLPAAYERRVTGTDPLDFDSDANVTEVDETDNGTIDGREDFDGDRLTTLQERELGTDPLTADSDGDGLADGDERALTRTDPLAADTDDDGTSDAAEDPDGDALTNAQEVANGTDPLYADLDGDGLDDAAELANGTNALVADTDGDGLLDGAELDAPFETDPTDNDTDDDGVKDGNETFTTETSNESLGVSIELTGQGDLASNSTVEPATHARFTAGRAPSESLVGEPVHVGVGGNLSEATVTVAYNESAITSNESSVALYRFNEATGAYHRLPSTVDAENDTISATTSHFSVIVPFDSVRAAAEARQQQQVAPPSFGGSTQTFEFDTNQPITIDSGETATINGAEWTCRNDPRSGGASDTPVLGTCEIRDGEAYVEEETNRMRYLEHTLTLPAAGPDSDVVVEANLTAHIEAAWSNAGITVVLEDENGDEYDIFRLEQDYASDTREVSVNPRVDVSQFAGQEVTLSFRADGRWTYQNSNTRAWVAVDNVTIDAEDTRLDSDGDGISDAWETNGIPLANTTRTVELDPNDPDTDGDGIDDGEEVNMDRYLGDQDLSDADVIHFPGYAWSSDPLSNDSDGDGLVDDRETHGWTVNVTRSNHQNYRWNPDGTEVQVSSNPLDPDTDGDGLPDGVEKNRTHTDPQQQRTYALTREHQQFIDEIEQNGNIRLAREMHVVLDGQPLSSVRLDDWSDDFDLVLTNGSTPQDRAVFTALDGEERTDTWLNNAEEWGAGTDPWDPDTDDDGLTDGQEYHGFTRTDTVRDGYGPRTSFEVVVEPDPTLEPTDPTDPDTDGDGYWDGWIGVYGVERTDNVVLYREHLQSGDGIEGDEIVAEQAGVHEVWQAGDVPAAVAAATVDYDGDGTIERSNLQVGERQWGTDPLTQSERIALSIETDFVQGLPNQRVNDSGWERGIEENYALYGIDIDIIRDERLPNTLGPDSAPRQISTDADQYMAVTTQSVFPGTGFNAYATTESFTTVQIPSTGMYVYATVIADSALPDRVDQRHLTRSPYENETQVVAAHVAMHEIGHSFGAGLNDDTGVLPFGEVYSGYEGSEAPNDPTPEGLPSRDDDWSIMRFGWDGTDPVFYHDGSFYYALSIEELATVTVP